MELLPWSWQVPSGHHPAGAGPCSSVLEGPLARWGLAGLHCHPNPIYPPLASNGVEGSEP